MRNAKLESALKEAGGCLFLCSGNMIRSAFAELYALHLGWSMPVRSAGTCYQNSRIHPETRSALLARGVEESLMARFQPRLISNLAPKPRASELVFGMTNDHLRQASAMGALGAPFLLTEALSEHREIADPYFEGGFEAVFADIARCVEALVG